MYEQETNDLIQLKDIRVASQGVDFIPGSMS